MHRLSAISRQVSRSVVSRSYHTSVVFRSQNRFDRDAPQQQNRREQDPAQLRNASSTDFNLTGRRSGQENDRVNTQEDPTTLAQNQYPNKVRDFEYLQTHDVPRGQSQGRRSGAQAADYDERNNQQQLYQQNAQNNSPNRNVSQRSNSRRTGQESVEDAEEYVRRRPSEQLQSNAEYGQRGNYRAGSPEEQEFMRTSRQAIRTGVQSVEDAEEQQYRNPQSNSRRTGAQAQDDVECQNISNPQQAERQQYAQRNQQNENSRRTGAQAVEDAERNPSSNQEQRRQRGNNLDRPSTSNNAADANRSMNAQRTGAQEAGAAGPSNPRNDAQQEDVNQMIRGGNQTQQQVEEPRNQRGNSQKRQRTSGRFY